MANLSSAEGTLELKVKGITCKEFFEALEEMQRGWEYRIDILDPVESYTHESTDSSDTYECEVSFFGIGRWGFQNTFDCICRSMAEDKVLGNCEWDITVDFADFEPGCMVLQQAVLRYAYQPGKTDSPYDRRGLHFLGRDVEDYECNICNYVDLGADISTAIESFVCPDDKEALEDLLAEVPEDRRDIRGAILEYLKVLRKAS